MDGYHPGVFLGKCFPPRENCSFSVSWIPVAEQGDLGGFFTASYTYTATCDSHPPQKGHTERLRRACCSFSSFEATAKVPKIFPNTVKIVPAPHLSTK